MYNFQIRNSIYIYCTCIAVSLTLLATGRDEGGREKRGRGEEGTEGGGKRKGWIVLRVQKHISGGI